MTKKLFQLRNVGNSKSLNLLNSFIHIFVIIKNWKIYEIILTLIKLYRKPTLLRFCELYLYT